jgi:MSHA pilin protein MshD
VSVKRAANQQKLNLGFTLIELVIGMLVFAIAMTFFIGLIVPQTTRSIDPIFQVRATELAQSLINEISSKSFDEHSSRNASERCGDGTAPACTLPNALGPDSESRSAYNDVDDFNGLDERDGNILSATGGSIGINGRNLYQGFRATISVFYDADLNGANDGAVGVAKLITVRVTTPNNEELVFSTYRYNY